MRKLTEDDVEFTIDIGPEDLAIEGNASAIDPETDAETVAWIRDQLERGNELAWCQIIVSCRLKGVDSDLRGVDSLGACSYESIEDFKRDGYYDDMKAGALADLQRQLDELSAASTDGRIALAVRELEAGIATAHAALKRDGYTESVGIAMDDLHALAKQIGALLEE